MKAYKYHIQQEDYSIYTQTRFLIPETCEFGFRFTNGLNKFTTNPEDLEQAQRVIDGKCQVMGKPEEVDIPESLVETIMALGRVYENTAKRRIAIKKKEEQYFDRLAERVQDLKNELFPEIRK